MTGVLGNVGQVGCLVLLVLRVVAMYAAVLLLWQPPPSLRRWSRVPWTLLAGGTVVIVLGAVGL
jgi:hypothetical protein